LRPAAKSEEPPIPVAIDLARTGAISTYYTATGTLEVEKQADVVARVTGIVTSIAVEEGDTVDDGHPLLEIGNGEYELRLAQAESKRRDLKAKFDRLETMSRDLISVEEYETARNDLATAEAEEGLARLNVSYATVTAPFRGRIVRRLADVGQNVTLNTPLFTIADFEPLLARVHVPAREFKSLATLQPVELVLDASASRLRGHIKLVSPVIDPTTGTIKVTVEISEYPPAVRPGDFAKVRIVTESRDGVTLVPRAAVFSDKGDQVVYVVSENVAERRVVSLGFGDDERAEILSGVQPGERVVVKGQRSLKHGSRVRILEDDELRKRSSAAASLGS
jgi:membrane fusion protein (multidrug efflux system)